MPALRHDPEDRETCSFCGIAEDVHLLDGVLDVYGQDTGKISCIRCYPVKDSWCPTGVKHIAISIAPELKPLYDEWLRQDAATRAEMEAHLKELSLP
jgi:hypothetical protein